jgi:hypothetical protein
MGTPQARERSPEPGLRSRDRPAYRCVTGVVPAVCRRRPAPRGGGYARRYAGLSQLARTVARLDVGMGGRRRIALAGAAVVIVMAVVGLIVGCGDGNEQVATGGSPRPLPYTGSLPELPLPNEERRVVTDPDEFEDLAGDQARAQAPSRWSARSEARTYDLDGPRADAGLQWAGRRRRGGAQRYLGARRSGRRRQQS